MSELEKDVKGREATERSESRDLATEGRQARALVPPVDIYEENDAIRVIADMPGVSPDSLRVELDNNVLTVEGDIQVDMPEGISATYAEIRGQRYHRRFSLGREIDADAIQAEVKDGVLNLVLPKKEAHRRRRIEIRAA